MLGCEEKLRNQRELMKEQFKVTKKRFDQVDKRFQDMNAKFRMMFTFVSPGFTILALMMVTTFRFMN